MDNFLAELYGTNEPEAEDFEKVAHLDFLEKVAEEEGIDLNELSDEDLEELAEIAAEALDEGEEYEDEEYEEYEDDDFEKEAEAKVEEADFLGRVMAHSFNQEMDNIDKEAGARMESVKSGFKRGYGAAKGVGAEAYGRGRRVASKRSLRALGESSSLGGRMKQRVRAAGKKVDKGVRGLGRRLGAESQSEGAKRGAKAGWRDGSSRQGSTRLRRMADVATFGKTRRRTAAAARGAAGGRKSALKSQRMRGYGALGGGAAGLGAAGAYAAGREKNSADEAMEEAVQARAWEHLMAAGLADNTGNYIPADDLNKTAADEQLDYDIDAAALELLESEGYPVEWY